MPARLPSDLLDRSAPESARVLALGYLDDIDRARLRLSDPLDDEALHDFRVGLRRLRSAIRAYREELKDSISDKMRRQLRDIARVTNDARDLEVQLAWLRARAEGLAREDTPGFFWLAGRLDDRKQSAHDRAVHRGARQYDRLGGKLRKALSVLRIELASGSGPRPASFRAVTGALVSRQAAQAREQLGRIRDASDAEQIHQTRIELKRLRYLLEPVARRNRRAGALVRLLREAQDLLGEHHDMHVLSTAVRALAQQRMSGTLPGLDRGLATVTRLADAAAIESLQRFSGIWGVETGNCILNRADELGKSLQQIAIAADAAPQAPVPEATFEIQEVVR